MTCDGVLFKIKLQVKASDFNEKRFQSKQLFVQNNFLQNTTKQLPLYFAFIIATSTSATAPTTILVPKSKETSIYIYLVPTVIMFILMIVLLLYFCKWYRQKSLSNDQVRFLEGGTVELTKYPVKMEQIISRGQFGNVWKGVYRDQTVAVKSVNMQGVKLWETERSMLESYNLRNENVINFVGSEKKTENNRIEYLIITEFYDNGSVADFLCKNIINLKILLRQILSMVKGLAYLHTEDKSMRPPKPLICHCDFKSRNVLVKKDLSCCISDFGVAYAFFKGTVNKEPKVQVLILLMPLTHFSPVLRLI